MDIALTDTIQAGKERGASRAFLSPDDKVLNSLDDLANGASRTHERLAIALRSASIDRLKSALATCIAQLNTDGALCVSSELTTRGIAPCFRYLEPLKQDDAPILTVSQRRELESEGAVVIRDDESSKDESQTLSAEFIMLCADLQWIVTKYPNHVPEWKRAESVFDPKRSRKAAEYLYWGGKREPGQIAKALALTEQQQRECAWIQCLHVVRWRERLLKRLPIAQARIASAIRDNDKRSGAAQDATIRRRCDLWSCAELGDWKPQRTADLYAMLTGETLSRHIVARQLSKLPKVRRIDEV